MVPPLERRSNEEKKGRLSWIICLTSEQMATAASEEALLEERPAAPYEHVTITSERGETEKRKQRQYDIEGAEREGWREIQ